MAQLQCRLIGLGGVVAQQDNYRRSGFQLAYNKVRYEGVPRCADPRDPDVLPLVQVPFYAAGRRARAVRHPHGELGGAVCLPRR